MVKLTSSKSQAQFIWPRFIRLDQFRKTKRQKPVDEKQKLDREMQRINQLINKRKAVGSGDVGVPEKMAKY